MDIQAQREVARLLASLRRDGRQQSGLAADLVPPDKATAYKIAGLVAEELGWPVRGLEDRRDERRDAEGAACRLADLRPRLLHQADTHHRGARQTREPDPRGRVSGKARHRPAAAREALLGRGSHRGGSLATSRPGAGGVPLHPRRGLPALAGDPGRRCGLRHHHLRTADRGLAQARHRGTRGHARLQRQAPPQRVWLRPRSIIRWCPSPGSPTNSRVPAWG